jgi:hypothetical protein
LLSSGSAKDSDFRSKTEHYLFGANIRDIIENKILNPNYFREYKFNASQKLE